MWLRRRQGLHSIIMYLMHNLQIITDFKFNSSCRDKISLWCAIWIYAKNNKTVIFSSTATQVLSIYAFNLYHGHKTTVFSQTMI